MELTTPWDMSSPNPITSPPIFFFITTFKSQVVDSKEDGEQTCSDKMGGGGG